MACRHIWMWWQILTTQLRNFNIILFVGVKSTDEANSIVTLLNGLQPSILKNFWHAIFQGLRYSFKNSYFVTNEANIALILISSSEESLFSCPRKRIYQNHYFLLCCRFRKLDPKLIHVLGFYFFFDEWYFAS